jgi:Cu+-exporting ATPase
VDSKEANAVANSSCVHVKINDAYKGFYEIANVYRPGMKSLITKLQLQKFNLHLLSGDSAAEKINLRQFFHSRSPLLFNGTPQEKLSYIKKVQDEGEHVLMVGDGLNDAGALMQADTGIAVSDDAARFSPACDAIIDGTVLHKLKDFISYAKAGRHIVLASFILSILYNVVGISYAVQGKLAPIVAAILMPASSISIVLFVTLLTSRVAKQKGL